MTTYDSTHTLSDLPTIVRALTYRAEDVARALLGQPTAASRHEHRWGSNGSFSLRLSGVRRGRWSDFESGERGDMLDLVARQHDVRLGEAIKIAERDYLGGPLVNVRAAPTPRQLGPAADDTEVRVNASLRTWSETVPIAGTLGERYFVEYRKLFITRLAIDHAVRWNARIRAIVTLMTDPVSGEPTGIHRTFLDADGAKLERKMLGRQGVVRLSPDDTVTSSLGVTEGIEDGIAVALSDWSPVWAVTSAGAMVRFPVLAGIEALTIFADADAPGIKAAESCASRWRAVGSDVRLCHGRG